MDLAPTFLILGAVFLAGLAADTLGRRTRLPRVTLLLGCGLVAGRSGLDLFPPEFEGLFDFLSVAALTMVAFLLGNSLTFKNLAKYGRVIVAVSWSIVAATLAIVAAGLWAAGVAIELALVLAAVACATDPAATQDILRQSGAKGGFPKTLRGIVAIDDAWGLFVFSLVLVAASAIQGGGLGVEAIVWALRDIFGAILLGLVIGLPGAFLTGRLGRGSPMQSEALGLVFLTAGLALYFDISFLIAGMTAGTVIANFARHHNRAFHEIEHIQWPFMLLFFVMAGAVLDVDLLWQVGWIGALYVVLRILARFVGGWVGARWAKAPREQQFWIGPALLPQAGVAVGMALVASETFPELRATIMALTVGTTVIFELIGPPITLLAVNQVAAAQLPKTSPGSRRP